MAKRSQLLGELAYGIEADADASHPGIDLYVDRHIRAAACRGLIQNCCFLDLRDHRRQAVVERNRFLAVPEATEAKDQFSDARLSELDSFLGKGDSKPVDTLSLEAFRAFDCSVAVGVGLDDRHVFRPRPDEAFHRAEIEGKVVEVDLGPGGPLRY